MRVAWVDMRMRLSRSESHEAGGRRQVAKDRQVLGCRIMSDFGLGLGLEFIQSAPRLPGSQWNDF